MSLAQNAGMHVDAPPSASIHSRPLSLPLSLRWRHTAVNSHEPRAIGFRFSVGTQPGVGEVKAFIILLLSVTDYVVSRISLQPSFV